MKRLPIIILVALFPAGVLAQSSAPNYSNTPDEMLPYRQFQAPHTYFFTDQQPFLGTGREKQAPSNLMAVKVGFLGPLELSREARLGRRMLQGALLAIEEANAGGGYRGLPFELVIRNDEGPWGTSSNTLVEIEGEGVWAFLGAIDGASTHVALRVALKLELPMVSSGSTDPTLTETRIPWYVKVNADDRQMGYALAAQIFQELGLKSVAVLRTNSRYGRAGIVEFRDAARRLGFPVVIEQRYAPGTTDFAAQLERIKASPVEAVVLWGDADEGGHIVKQMRAMGMEHPVFGSDRLIDPLFLEIAGPAAEGVVAGAMYDAERADPKYRAFARRYHARFGEEAEAFAAHAYDGMNVIIGAIRAGGLNRARIRDAMTGLGTYDGVTGEIIFDPSWNDVGPVYLATVRDGGFQYTPSPLARRANP